MSYEALPPEIRHLAETTLTERQLVAFKLWENGAGYRRIGLILNISSSSARGRVVRAVDTINRTMERDGHDTDTV